MENDLISRRDVINAMYALADGCERDDKWRENPHIDAVIDTLENLPSAQPDRLSNDDFETIRIHLNAYKESLCNQRRWKEAEEYQRIIDRFMAFASAQPKTGQWNYSDDMFETAVCSCCGWDSGESVRYARENFNYRPKCGEKMER